ncbi:SipW-dependent-type signal peptide-containing protein [Microbacterium gorillae]|uniref:SipW-dependent-type signal peptide-containing protein n=1 Tax=Microbacterium gorillae TaxID=1231063 RepID=UPI0006943C0B|nr:SipW-dependent-type signal peptide-containing protein [Microbacterium gorillae]
MNASTTGCRPRRRARVRSRLSALVLTTLVLGGGTVLGLSAAGGTYALLSDRATVPGATITAGRADLQVNGAASAGLGTWDLTPATPRAKSFTVSNTDDVPLQVSARAIVTSATAIAANTRARLTPVPSGSACTTGLSGALGALSGYAVAPLETIAAGATRTYCLELVLLPSTPVGQSGQGVSFTLTLDGTQVGG